MTTREKIQELRKRENPAKEVITVADALELIGDLEKELQEAAKWEIELVGLRRELEAQKQAAVPSDAGAIEP